MRIDYHDLHDTDFERLVVAICMEILGAGVASFCSGPDGSRDARFEGTAAHFPSPANPYKGKFIIQAKHTESPVAKYSDTDFSGPSESSLITKEIPGIRRLVDGKHLDHYFLFSNRRMSGVAEDPIRSRIAKDSKANVVELFGIERMDTLLKKFQGAMTTFGMEPMHLPLLITCDDLAEVILVISDNVDTFESAFRPDDLERVSFATKNTENGLSEDFATYIRKNYLSRFADVKKLLANPRNESLLERYQSVVEEFNEQIAIHRSKYATFDDVLVRITKLLFLRDGDLARNKALAKLVVYYMYWNCDIGSGVGASDASAE